MLKSQRGALRFIEAVWAAMTLEAETEVERKEAAGDEAGLRDDGI